MDKNKTNYNSGSSKNKKGARKKNDSHRFAYNENDYDYANAVNIDNFSTFSFKWIWEPWMGFLVGEEVEDEINVIITKTKIRWRIGFFRVKKGFTNAYTLLAQSWMVVKTNFQTYILRMSIISYQWRLIIYFTSA